MRRIFLTFTMFVALTTNVLAELTYQEGEAIRSKHFKELTRKRAAYLLDEKTRYEQVKLMLYVESYVKDGLCSDAENVSGVAWDILSGALGRRKPTFFNLLYDFWIRGVIYRKFKKIHKPTDLLP